MSEAARLCGRYPRKDALLPGVSDADLAIVDLDRSWSLDTAELPYRHPWTPQHGAEVRGRVVPTVRRGEVVFADDTELADPGSGIPV